MWPTGLNSSLYLSKIWTIFFYSILFFLIVPIPLTIFFKNFLSPVSLISYFPLYHPSLLPSLSLSFCLSVSLFLSHSLLFTFSQFQYLFSFLYNVSLSSFYFLSPCVVLSSLSSLSLSLCPGDLICLLEKTFQSDNHPSRMPAWLRYLLCMVLIIDGNTETGRT